MSAQPNPAPSDPQPFFSDTRTFAEKLAVTEREWRPHQPQHNCPAIVCGLVLELGTFVSAYDDGDTLTTCRILTEDNVVWSVVAFHGYLQNEFDRKRPQVGDFVAFVYRGTVPAKTGQKDAYDYLVVVEKNPEGPQPPVGAIDDATALELLAAIDDSRDADADDNGIEPGDDIPF